MYFSEERRRQLEILERQLIPFLNSLRRTLGKPPIIVPKQKKQGRVKSEAIDSEQDY